MPRTQRMRAGVRGFTLLEAIVTLVIASLIVVVLMQALQQSLGLRTRLLRHERETRMAGLQEQWFRDTLASTVHDLPDALGPFRGDREHVEFVSASPLRGQGIVRAEWALVPVSGGASLVYRDAGQGAVTVIPGPLHEARFDYLDAGEGWVPEWAAPDPDPDAPPSEEPILLPRMVRLRATTTSGEMAWLVPIVADPRQTTLLRPEDAFLGL